MDKETVCIDPALHAAASKGFLCADCTIDKEACPTCYKVWWQRRHPNVQQRAHTKDSSNAGPLFNGAFNVDNKEIEQEIQNKGLTAPRVTLAGIESIIAIERYSVGPLGVAVLGPAYREDLEDSLYCLTLCVLVLKNGFTVIGQSACASPENFDDVLGRKIARQNAIDKIWVLEGYLLKQQLFDEDNRAPGDPRMGLSEAWKNSGGGDFGDS